MKFTACEAEDIRPLAVNSPLMDRGYDVMSVGRFAVPLRASVRHADVAFQTEWSPGQQPRQPHIGIPTNSGRPAPCEQSPGVTGVS
jgi:hypothetical protein